MKTLYTNSRLATINVILTLHEMCFFPGVGRLESRKSRDSVEVARELVRSQSRLVLVGSGRLWLVVVAI